MRARRRFAADALRDECLDALYGYFHPTRGGPDGDGWPFGRPIHVGEVYSVLQRLPGVEIIEDARLFAADPVTGERGEHVQRLAHRPQLARVQLRAPGAGGVVTSARGQLDGLGVRTPIGQALPAMFHDDAFAQRLCDGLDAVLAPVPSTIDNFWAYLDPALAPIDFVEWLAAWVGLELDQTWPEERRRELVAQAIKLYERRGTAEGLADLIELYVGVRPTVEDSGGVAWSAAPGADLPGVGTTDADRAARRRGGLRRRAAAGEYGGDEQAGARRPPDRDRSATAAATGQPAAAPTDRGSGAAEGGRD